MNILLIGSLNLIITYNNVSRVNAIEFKEHKR